MTIESISNGEVGSSVRTKLNAVISAVNDGSGTGISAFRSITTTTYTLSDANHEEILLVDNSVSCTITVPHGLQEAFQCTAFQLGAGQVIIAMGTSTTKLPAAYDRTAYQGAPLSILQYSNGSTDYYLLSGAIV